jgi:hypothetical protein
MFQGDEHLIIKLPEPRQWVGYAERYKAQKALLGSLGSIR